MFDLMLTENLSCFINNFLTVKKECDCFYKLSLKHFIDEDQQYFVYLVFCNHEFEDFFYDLVKLNVAGFRG